MVLCCGGLKAYNPCEYHPLLEDDKVWILHTENSADPEFEPYHTKVWVDRDTLFKDEPSKVIRIKNEISDTIISVVLKEENKQIFYASRDCDYWLPLLDFNCNAGGTTMNSSDGYEWYSGIPVNEEGKLKLFDVEYRFLKIWWYTWIEGIGSPDLYFLTMRPVPTCGPIPTTKMVECYKGDKLIFTKDEFRKVSGIVTPIIEEKCFPIYDIHGRKITNPQPGNIYIRNGKIFLAK